MRNTLAIVESDKYGMQGRLLHIQEHPFEGQTNYAAIAALRCNFDVQVLRRVSAVHRKKRGEEMPQLDWLEPDEKCPTWAIALIGGT